MSTTPALIADFVSSINAGDTQSFLAFFRESGVVVDWGRRFAGRNAIRNWSDRELIGARGTMTVLAVLSSTPAEIVCDMDWKSSFFSGASRFRFVLDGGSITELHISES